MLQIDVRSAVPGMSLALPVRHPQQPGTTLLKANYRLEPETISRLQSLRVRSVWVRYPSLEFLSRYVDPAIMQQRRELFDKITQTFTAAQNNSCAKLPFAAYTRAVGNLVSRLLANPQAALFMSELDGADGSLMRHSSASTYLSVLLGLKLEGYLVRQRKHIDPARAREVVNLGVGAMLHDVGVTRLDEQVRERYLATGDDRDEDFREHTKVGYEMVRGRVEPSAATVVLNHHQRYDGSGYAGRGTPVLSEQRIHVFARIAGAVEQFDRMCNPPGEPVRPTVGVLREMITTELAEKFDPQVLRALVAVVPPFAPGAIVVLSDGQHAVVTEPSLHEPCRPKVQIIPEPRMLREDDPAGPTLDLNACSSNLYIARCQDADVSELNFHVPDTLRPSDLMAMQW